MISYNTSIVRDGLVLHLDAANVKSYPGSGTTWSDLSGNGNHGTINSGVEYSSNGFTADAQGEGIVVSFPSQTIWTLSLWFRKNGTGTGYARIAGTGPLVDRGEVAVLSNSLRINGPEAGWTVAGAGIENNEVTNIVVSFDTSSDSDNVLVHKNGINTLTATQTAFESLPTSYTFMQRRDYNTEWLPSTLFCASLYSRVLSDSEIQQNFEALRGRYGI